MDKAMTDGDRDEAGTPPSGEAVKQGRGSRRLDWLLGTPIPLIPPVSDVQRKRWAKRTEALGEAHVRLVSLPGCISTAQRQAVATEALAWVAYAEALR